MGRKIKDRIGRRRLPNIDVPQTDNQALRDWAEGIKEHLRMYEGDSGAPKERFVTLEELEAAGLVTLETKQNFATISEKLGDPVPTVKSDSQKISTGTPGTGPGTPGANAVTGFIEPENGLVWSQAIDGGAWSPAQLTTDLDVTFKLGPDIVARVGYRATLTSGDGTIAVTATTHPDGDYNSQRIAVTLTNDGTTAVTVQFTYTYLTDTGIISTGVSSTVGAASGLSVFIGQVFLRKGSAPTEPINDDGSYNFSTKTLTAPSIGGGSADDWFTAVPAGSNPLYVCTGNFQVVGQTGTDSTVDWTAPVVLASDGADGSDGSDGNSTFVGSVYLRKSSSPTEPVTNDGSYNFSTGVLTAPSTGGGSADNWSTTPPAADGNPLYVSVGLFEINGTSGTDSTVDWTAPAVVLPDSGFRDIIFKRSATAPSTPTGDGTPSGWFNAVPNGTDTVWSSTGSKNSADELIGAWSAPQLVQGMVYRGAYAAGTAYLVHDVVAYNERTYICVQAGTGNAPSGTNSANSYWDLIAGKGDTGDPPTTFTETIAITGSTGVNLRNLADNHTPAYDGIADATITFTIGNSITLSGTAGGGGSGNAGHAVDTGTWPTGATIALTLENDGVIRGGGGGGGDGGSPFVSINGQVGGDGGDAIYCQEDLTVDNSVGSGGTIQAGGGAGGGGGGAEYPASEPIERGGGGGGGGFPNGGFGDGGAGASSGANGSAGTGGGGGGGGAGAGNAGNGGAGGNVNVVGTSGGNGTGSHTNGSGGSGGARGYALRKNGHTATITGGTVTGTQG